MRIISLLVILALGLLPATAEENQSAWQAQKCALFEENWSKALDFFGSDNLNYNFIAQNENFIASGCVDAPSICPQSSQELDIANALTIALMNAGTASTFLPYRCSSDVSQATPAGSVEAQLCRAQLELLQRGKKLTDDEAAVFEAQCTCLENRTGAQSAATCAQRG